MARKEEDNGCGHFREQEVGVGPGAEGKVGVSGWR